MKELISLKYILRSSILMIFLVFGFYFIFFVFYDQLYEISWVQPLINKFSISSVQWAEFGNFIGGTLSPILAFFALMALLYSIEYQIDEFKKSSNALIAQNELINKQLDDLKNNRKRESLIIRIDETNKIILKIIYCLKTLLEIKKFYFYELTTHPIQRLIETGEFLIDMNSVNPDLSEMHYLIIRNKKDGGKNNADNLTLLIHLFTSYNSLMFAWQSRNKIRKHIIDILLPSLEEVKFEESNEKAGESLKHYDQIGKKLIEVCKISEIMHAIDMTEKVLSSTDQLIKGLNDILLSLPVAAESYLESDFTEEYFRSAQYLPILRYVASENEKDRDLVEKKIIEIDENIFYKLFGTNYKDSNIAKKY